jgi:hypothetical protein
MLRDRPRRSDTESETTSRSKQYHDTRESKHMRTFFKVLGKIIETIVAFA